MMRSRFRSIHTAVVTSGLTAAFTSVALAQEPVPAAPPPVVVETPAAPPAVEPAPLPPVAPPAPVYLEPAPAPAPFVPEQHATAETPEPADEASPPWYEGLSVGAFVDAYGAIRSDNNGNHGASAANAQAATNAAPGVTNPGVVGAFGHDAYVEASGFALAFAGVDVAYSGEKFGATISLRFGPGVNRFYGADQSAFGIQNITQGYVTYKPTEKLTLDLGQFYTIYGAEVAESWRNQNYSRGALYYAMQPFWHTGLKANYKFNDMFAVNAMVVNGVNTAFEGNKSPTLGIQVLANPVEQLALAVGYMTGLNPRTGDDETIPTKNFQDFVDVVATVTLGDFKLVMNADVNSYRPKTWSARERWWGLSFAPSYAITEWFGIAARAEYLVDTANAALAMAGGAAASFYTPGSTDAAGAMTAAMGGAPGDKVHLTTLTGTLNFMPVPGETWIILRPEFRYEIASKNDYTDHDAKLSKHFWSAHLGAVVTSMK
ncbi:MAG: hypothetical protein JWN48_5047 [Myxococcaceae bacterium]|nr:hypothetical protein [Myxococcaceae bacterium]